MASVFTYDPDPPKVSSPWPDPPVLDPGPLSAGQLSTLNDAESSLVTNLADLGITKLEAEPQEGPVEYKLHLLLRPRQQFCNLSTAQHVSGSHQSKSRASQSGLGSEPRQAKLSSSPVPSSQSRHNRLQHLTTQLLWRLQQSSPYHSSSKSDLFVPVLPQAEANLSKLDGPDKLLPGLEESQGALYELGVSDDGTFVGLTEDELEESLATLRAMAFSLGCRIQVLRKIIVGDCQWSEEAESRKNAISQLRHESVFVAEALVFPDLGFCQDAVADNAMPLRSSIGPGDTNVEKRESQIEQLRVSLTGNTISGKSSLLGTLSTSTLDNGRGKSRLSLLKHRHEIVSGVSSSVTPEVIGYHDITPSEKTKRCWSTVINYASRNISSWNDIHNASEPGRLVLVTDSAGHPRYRRTALRGLVSWAPHWAMCCIAADSDDNDAAEQDLMATAHDKATSREAEVDSSTEYLVLCLKLNLPSIVILTKLDIASKTGLRQVLDKILSILKYAGRIPCFVQKNIAQTKSSRLQSVAADDREAVLTAISSCCNSGSVHLATPIVFTSAVGGFGISRVHALLRYLPIPDGEKGKISHDVQHQSLRCKVLFHIDEVYSKLNHPSQKGQPFNQPQIIILSGYLRYGALAIGDNFLVGPFSSGGEANIGHGIGLHQVSSLPQTAQPGSQRSILVKHNDRLSLDESLNSTTEFRRKLSSRALWPRAHIVSIRNLRLPVRKLAAGQMGTIGVTWDDPQPINKDQPSISNLRVRKGMVMICPQTVCDGQLPYSYSGFVAIFSAKDYVSLLPRTRVIAYIASVRATVKVISAQSSTQAAESPTTQTKGQQEIMFQFVASREWIELDTQVLIMAECSTVQSAFLRKGKFVDAWSNGFVGRITKVLE